MFYTTLPATPLFGLRKEIDRLFDDSFTRSGNAVARATPAVDVHEDVKALTFELELPGVRPEQVEVVAENGVLTVKGEKSSQHADSTDKDRWHLLERSYGAFKRSFQLPKTADQNAIEASFANGVLTIRVAKTAVALPRKIEVKAS